MSPTSRPSRQRSALVAYRRTREFRGEQEALTASLIEYARLSTLRYRGGVASYLEVLDAERQLFSAELDLARARREELLAVVQLYKALGGGWQMEAAPAAEASPDATGPLQVNTEEIRIRLEHLDGLLQQDSARANAIFRQMLEPITLIPVEKEGKRFYRASGTARGAEMLDRLGLA